MLSVVNILSSDVINKYIFVNIIGEIINIPERFKEKSSRRFVYFISTTIKIYVCTSHLYMSTIPVISETQQGGKPCPKKIHYTILLVSPSTSLSKTISPSIKTYWAPFKNPTPFTINISIGNAPMISSSNPTSYPS